MTKRIMKTRRIKGVKRPAIRHEEEEQWVVGYQYHPPRKRIRDKLREIIRILKE